MNKKRIAAGTLSAAIVITNIGMSGGTVYAADVPQTGKEEVVYIITDASGKTDSVNVVNIFGKGDVTDYGNYSTVKMLNTTDAISQSGDQVTFSSDKDKVYYQGTLDQAELPWNIAITYELDGKKIKPKELAGKSGKLKMHIAVTKNEQADSDFYDQFALQAAFTLDTEKCENITADGATIANVGANKQISYTVLPGKGLDAEITADVTDFEMEAAAINGVKLDLDIDIDDAELMDKVSEIMDAADQLNDGAGELSDGTSQLKDGGSSLLSGVDSLNSGAASLNEGMESLSSGTTQMQSALDTLHAQSAQLTGGSGQMLLALQTIQAELSNVSVTTEQLKQLTDSSLAIRQGIADAYNGAVELQKSLSADSYKAAMKANGLDVDALQAGNAQAVDTLSEQIASLSASVEQLKNIPGYESSEVYQAQAAQLEAQIESLNQILVLLKGNSAAINGTSQYFSAASDGAARLVDGLARLNESYTAFDAAIAEMADTLSGMVVKVNTMKTGMNELVDSYKNLDSGIEAYTDGVAEITAAYTQIVNGTTTLVSGSRELAGGASDLKQGTADLYDGIVSVDDGAVQLSDGTNEFYTKTSDMDTQVETQIDDMLDEISGGDDPVESFVSAKNMDVASVQFVIKTGEIKKETVEETKTEETVKKSFLEKLKDLF